MPDKAQLKAFNQYTNRSLSRYRTKKDRRTGTTTCNLSIQCNGDIMNAISERAKEEGDDIDDWILLQLIEALDKPGKDNRPLKEKIDRPKRKR